MLCSKLGTTGVVSYAVMDSGALGVVLYVNGATGLAQSQAGFMAETTNNSKTDRQIAHLQRFQRIQWPRCMHSTVWIYVIG